MILCVTLNPVLDTTFFVDKMRPIYRTEAQRENYVAGGKGDNVARALGILGEPRTRSWRWAVTPVGMWRTFSRPKGSRRRRPG